MQSFPDMAEAHEWTLRRLREMAGRLTEQAYLRASEAQAPDGGYDAETAQRWMLVFDRMARGLRLSIALEARLARERRWDADEIARKVVPEAEGERCTPRRRQPAEAAGEADPYEADRERDDDGLPSDAPLGRRIERLKAIVEGAVVPAPERAQAGGAAMVWVDEFRPGSVHSAVASRPDSVEPPWRGSG
jgi:hypothetical protein